MLSAKFLSWSGKKLHQSCLTAISSFSAETMSILHSWCFTMDHRFSTEFKSWLFPYHISSLCNRTSNVVGNLILHKYFWLNFQMNEVNDQYFIHFILGQHYQTTTTVAEIAPNIREGWFLIVFSAYCGRCRSEWYGLYYGLSNSKCQLVSPKKDSPCFLVPNNVFLATFLFFIHLGGQSVEVYNGHKNLEISTHYEVTFEHNTP